MSPLSISAVVLVIIGLILGIMLLFHIVKSLGWKRVRAERSFELLVLVGALDPPATGSLPHQNGRHIAGSGLEPDGLHQHSRDHPDCGHAGYPLPTSTAIGLWWKTAHLGDNAIIFYGIFVVFYTTFFTNVTGFFSGIIGSLGYWLEQQGEVRGSQPFVLLSPVAGTHL